MFNFFKKSKKDNPDSPAQEDYLKAKEQFDQSNFSDALGTLIGGFKKDINHRPLYELASASLSKMGGTEESNLFTQASKSLNIDSFKKLGHHFYSVEHYPLSKIFLEEVFRQEKDPQVANELAITYARRFDTKKAEVTLELVKDKFDFWMFWFYVKTKILNNNQDQLNEQIEELERAFDPNDPNENLVVPRLKVKELREAYERLLAVEQPEVLVRDWHFIQYGSVILDFFFDDNQYVAGGRYVAAWGQNQSILANLKCLVKLLSSKPIGKIVYANDRDSQIIGLALAQLMNIPSVAFAPQQQFSNSLLVAADSSSFNEFDNVEYIASNNITFAYNQNWLTANFICPDIIAMLSQSFFYPWKGGNIKMNPDGSTSRTEPDERTASDIASDILNAEVTDETTLDPFYDKFKNLLQINKSAGHRYNFMVETPVPGSYFGAN